KQEKITHGQIEAARINKLLAKTRYKAFQEAGFQRSKHDYDFRVICSLYWGEGTKDKNSFSVSNCDSDMLKLIGKWLVGEGYSDIITFRIQYYDENGLSEREVRNYWMNELPFLTENNFRKSTICKINRASQRKKIGTRPYGTATITVHRTELVQSIYGGIAFLKNGCVV
ncbi:MAG: hypothetical protein M0P12_13295, partial [Paludibacteraceae bacterium]|nr:hypothetical protein [Paludibacteraceae bacterium]